MVAVKDMMIAAAAVLSMSTLVAPYPIPRPTEEQEEVAYTGVRGAPLAFPFRHGVYNYGAPVHRRVVGAEESWSLRLKLDEPKSNGTNATRPLGGWKPRKGLADLRKDGGAVCKVGDNGTARGGNDYEDARSDKDGEDNDEDEEEGITEDPDGDNADGNQKPASTKT
ncbi:predicted protein [Aspergillus terreus NIH2624]|uniref:Uncharacterized protein n=1 Tax=Aspergillus terreus (strain NIH 2624 / FGSC A1156) TaxID=341663 RepID=Q0D1F2_ASPTN|nr:uncharacterized protein ATEG_00232 [Aspergillus terreus NIH2624]EAU38878.1 predicted protein [Aspergillus terreus NIH2624]